MTGVVRHRVQRGDGFWARIVVPKAPRSIIATAERQAPFGSRHKLAECQLHAAAADFHDPLARLGGKAGFVFRMAPSFQQQEPPSDPGRYDHPSAPFHRLG